MAPCICVRHRTCARCQHDWPLRSSACHRDGSSQSRRAVMASRYREKRARYRSTSFIQKSPTPGMQRIARGSMTKSRSGPSVPYSRSAFIVRSLNPSALNDMCLIIMRHSLRFPWGVSTKTWSARHVRGRRSTRRPKAQLPPHQTALVEPVHSQNGGRGHFVLSWAVPPKDYRSYRFAKTPPVSFFANLGGPTSAFEAASATQSSYAR